MGEWKCFVWEFWLNCVRTSFHLFYGGASRLISFVSLEINSSLHSVRWCQIVICQRLKVFQIERDLNSSISDWELFPSKRPQSGTILYNLVCKWCYDPFNKFAFCLDECFFKFLTLLSPRNDVYFRYQQLSQSVYNWI